MNPLDSLRKMIRKIAEFLFFYFKSASRHVMSGAAGGLVATYSVRDWHWIVISVLGFVFITMVSGFYRGIETADYVGQKIREYRHGAQPERIRNDWPEGRAS